MPFNPVSFRSTFALLFLAALPLSGTPARAEQVRPAHPVHLHCERRAMSNDENALESFAVTFVAGGFTVTRAQLTPAKSAYLQKLVQEYEAQPGVTQTYAARIKRFLAASAAGKLAFRGGAFPYVGHGSHPDYSRYQYATTVNPALRESFENDLESEYQLLLLVQNPLLTGEAETGRLQLMYRGDQGPSSDIYECSPN